MWVGPAGEQGPAGADGKPGPAGEQGPPGESVIVYISEDTPSGGEDGEFWAKYEPAP